MTVRLVTGRSVLVFYRSRETENLEYLKNIIIHYMSADSAGRDQMINPIATVLHFSKDEVLLYCMYCNHDTLIFDYTNGSHLLARPGVAR